MVASSGPTKWTAERFKLEVDQLVIEMGGVPDEQKLGYMKGRLAGFPEPYRRAAVTILLAGEAIMAQSAAPNGGHFAFLREAIQAVPAVKYALGVGGIATVIGIVCGIFGISYRVAAIGVPVMLVLMTVLVIFSRLAAANAASFLVPLTVLTWFSLVVMIATVVLIFTGVFFRWPLDLHKWLV